MQTNLTDDVLVKWKHKGEGSSLDQKREVPKQTVGSNILSLKISLKSFFDGGELQQAKYMPCKRNRICAAIESSLD